MRRIPKSRQGKREQGWAPRALWGCSRASGTEEYQGDPYILLLPLHTATISESPVWAKGSHALPETASAPERAVWFEYTAVNETLLIDCHFYCRQ